MTPDRLCYLCHDFGRFVRDASGAWRCQVGHEALPIVARYLEAPEPAEKRGKAQGEPLVGRGLFRTDRGLFRTDRELFRT